MTESSKYRRKVWTWLVLAGLIVTAGYVLGREGEIVIPGRQYDYKIPGRYLKTFLWFSFLEDLSGFDDAASTAIIVPLDDIGLKSTVSDVLRMIWFYDHDYEKDLLPENQHDTRYLFEDYVLLEQNKKYYIFQDDVLDMVAYYTYDPKIFPRQIAVDDYYVSIMTGTPFVRKGQPPPDPISGCDMFLRRDGIGMDIGFLGTLCAVENFETIIASVDDLMAKWRINKP